MMKRALARLRTAIGFVLVILAVLGCAAVQLAAEDLECGR